jgi:uncharacterized protein (TIGR02596 family)
MRRRAFSLVELLVVMAIMVLVLTLLTPAFNSVLRGGAITRSGQSVSDQLALARQTAIARNQIVTVRFLKMPGDGVETEPRYRGMQAVAQQDDGSLKPLSRVVKLDPNNEISDTAELSTIIAKPSVSGSTDVAGKSVPYAGFRFRPDGSTDLDLTSSDGWYLTIKDTQPSADPIPTNFFTIRMDPFTGQTRVFRP